MYFEWARSPADQVVFSVTGASCDAARHALSVSSHVALAVSDSSGSVVAPAGTVDPGSVKPTATVATTTIASLRQAPAQWLTFRTLPGAVRGLQAAGQIVLVSSATATIAAIARRYQPKIERSCRCR